MINSKHYVVARSNSFDYKYIKNQNTMNAQLVRVVAAKLGVATERVFGLSFEWAESRHSRKYIVNQFKLWYFNGKIHPDVEDFILDVMSGRVLQKELPYDASRPQQPANLPK